MLAGICLAGICLAGLIVAAGVLICIFCPPAALALGLAGKAVSDILILSFFTAGYLGASEVFYYYR